MESGLASYWLPRWLLMSRRRNVFGLAAYLTCLHLVSRSCLMSCAISISRCSCMSADFLCQGGGSNASGRVPFQHFCYVGCVIPPILSLPLSKPIGHDNPDRLLSSQERRSLVAALSRALAVFLRLLSWAEQGRSTMITASAWNCTPLHPQ